MSNKNRRGEQRPTDNERINKQLYNRPVATQGSYLTDHSEYYIQNNFGLEFYSYTLDTYTTFKAWMDGFTDSFTTNWNSEVVFGRPDPYQIYQNTERSLSLEFNILASSIEEAIGNLENMSLLAKMNYPSYSAKNGNAATIVGAPVFRMKFANLITSTNNNLNSPGTVIDDGLIGVINGISFDFKLSEGVLISEAGNIYPKEVGVSLTYLVLHDSFVGAYKNNWNGDDSFPYIKDAPRFEEFESSEGDLFDTTLPSNTGRAPRDANPAETPSIRNEDDQTQVSLQSQENERIDKTPNEIKASINSTFLTTGFDIDGAPPTQLAK